MGKEIDKNNEILTKLVDCFNNIGIDVTYEELEKTEDIGKMIEESIVFISLIVEIEENFNIEFDEEHFAGNTFKDIHNLCEGIKSLMNNKD